MWKIIFCFLLINPICLAAQKSCPDYDNWMKIGNDALKNDNLDEALKGFQNAQIAADECKINNADADEGVRRVFFSIKEQNRKALKAKAEAVSAKKAADSAKIVVEKQKAEVELALKKANSLIKVFEAQKVLSIKPTNAFLIAYDAFELNKSVESLKILMDTFHNIHYHTTIELTNKLSVMAVSVAADKIAFGFDNGEIIITNDKFEILFKDKVHLSKITALSFDETGNALASASDNFFFKVNTLKGRIIHSDKNSYQINTIIWQDNAHVYLGASDGKIRSWNLNTRRFNPEEYFDITLIDVRNVFLNNKFIYGINTEGYWKWDIETRKILVKRMNIDAKKIIVDKQDNIWILKNDNRIVKLNIADNYAAPTEIFNNEASQRSSKLVDFYRFRDNAFILIYDDGYVTVVDLNNNKNLGWMSQIENTDMVRLVGDNIFISGKNTINIWNYHQINHNSKVARDFSININEANDYSIVKNTDSLMVLRYKYAQKDIEFNKLSGIESKKANQIINTYAIKKKNFYLRTLVTLDEYNKKKEVNLQYFENDSVSYNFPVLVSKTLNNVFITADLKHILTKEYDKSQLPQIWFTPIYIQEFRRNLKTIKL